MDKLETDNYKLAFIIAHKYFRGYESYLKYYISNILNFYNDSLILVVDNNSKFKEDVFNTIPPNDNIKFLDNNIDCKFELGAYQVGIRYLKEKNLVDKYDYCIFTQDNFILKNKYDFNNLINNNILACPINSYIADGDFKDLCEEVLGRIGLNNNYDKMTFCWCSSFIVHNTKIEQLYRYLVTIVIKVRTESCASERYLARILWELNDHRNNDIDGDIRYLGPQWNGHDNIGYKYECHSVSPYDKINAFFVKRVQGKTEGTVDKETVTK
jgi:hypothetical protein